jgi:hypothetical protein
LKGGNKVKPVKSIKFNGSQQDIYWFENNYGVVVYRFTKCLLLTSFLPISIESCLFAIKNYDGETYDDCYDVLRICDRLTKKKIEEAIKKVSSLPTIPLNENYQAIMSRRIALHKEKYGENSLALLYYFNLDDDGEFVREK